MTVKLIPLVPVQLLRDCEILEARNIRHHGYSVNPKTMYQYATEHLAVETILARSPNGTEAPIRFGMVSDYKRLLKVRFGNP